MKRINLLLLIALVALVSCKSKLNPKSLIVMNYNVENLFDTIDDPEKIDEEFTPESKKQWTEKRYEQKLSDLAKVISNVNTKSLPAIIGLEEIENQKVLEDLVAQPSLKKGNYAIAHYESPDKRGIDVALLYNPKILKLIHSEALHVNPGFATRDILHAEGKIGGENFHIYVNHWPSRIGGTEQSEPHRIAAANVLKESIDKVLAANPNANIVVMGDMNDEPQNKSIYETLGAKLPSEESRLVNLMLPADLKDEGTYNFRGNWNMLDNLIVSKSLLDSNGLKVSDNIGHIFHQPWMEYISKKNGDMSPNRTYGGPNYYGGVSDHFPVYFTLQQ